MKTVLALALVIGALMSPSPGLSAAPGDGLAAARSLYLATQYEDALTLLTNPTQVPPSDEADVYKALCLLALGRNDEVDAVLTSLVTRNPAFELTDAAVTPRLVTVFTDVRRRTLDRLTREQYADAKASYDAANYADASAKFARLLTNLAREDAAMAEDTADTRDMRQLAQGFKDLSDAELARAAAAAAAETRAAEAEAAAVVVPRPETLIENVIERYALAYSALDAAAVTRVFPAESQAALASGFSKLKSQTVETHDMSVALNSQGDTATANMTWVVEAVPKVGSPIKAERPTMLTLKRTADGNWTIVGRK